MGSQRVGCDWVTKHTQQWGYRWVANLYFRVPLVASTTKKEPQNCAHIGLCPFSAALLRLEGAGMGRSAPWQGRKGRSGEQHGPTQALVENTTLQLGLAVRRSWLGKPGLVSGVGACRRAGSLWSPIGDGHLGFTGRVKSHKDPEPIRRRHFIWRGILARVRQASFHSYSVMTFDDWSNF